MLDLRLPSGLFFAITGIALVIYGIMIPADINLYSGAVMAAFGAILLLLAWRGREQ